MTVNVLYPEQRGGIHWTHWTISRFISYNFYNPFAIAFLEVKCITIFVKLLVRVLIDVVIASSIDSFIEDFTIIVLLFSYFYASSGLLVRWKNVWEFQTFRPYEYVTDEVAWRTLPILFWQFELKKFLDPK